MSTDPQGPSSPSAEGHSEEEVRGLWLRLLRLIATEVATQLRERAGSAIRRRVVWDKQGSPESNRGPVAPDRGNCRGPKSPPPG